MVERIVVVVVVVVGHDELWFESTDRMSAVSDRTVVLHKNDKITYGFVRFWPSNSSYSSTAMTTSLDQLKQTGTVVVSDSGDFECKSTCADPRHPSH